MKKTVITVKGESHPKNKTRCISGDYYKIGDVKVKDSGDCYFIDGKYYRFDTGYIQFDHRSGEYKVFNQNEFINNGVVGFSDDGKPIFGGFKMEGSNNDIIYINIAGIKYPSLNEEILISSKLYLEDLESGIYYHRQLLPSSRFVFPIICRREIKERLPYDSREILEERIKIFKSYDENKNYLPSVESYAKSLKDLSFGFEFETNVGNIPQRICKKLGLIPLRDGSIDGLEFVTIPLRGKSGMQSVIESVKQLKKRTDYDESCSLHLHIGNIPRTEKFILALFKLLCFIQDDVYELFPLYKKYNFGYKKKHYTKPFPIKDTLLLMDTTINDDNIKDNFNILFEYISMGIPYSTYNSNLDKVNCHPSDPNGTSKWQIKTRYMAYNLVPIIFGNKETVEFRLHTPTYDINKIMNYLFICTSIVNYAKINQDKILENPKFLRDVNLNSILYSIGLDDNLVDHLSNYISQRKNAVFNMNRESNIHFKEDELSLPRGYIRWDEKVNTNNPIYFNKRKNNINRYRNIPRQQFNMVDEQGNNIQHLVVNQREIQRLREEFEAARILGGVDVLQDVEVEDNNLNF